MLTDAEIVAFVATRDLACSRRFYRDALGLELIESTEFADAYDARGTQLRVTLVPGAAPAGHTVLGWRVPDVRAAIADLSAAGIPVLRFDAMEQDEDGVWRAPGGSLIAWFADPDGNTLSLQQPPQR